MIMKVELPSCNMNKHTEEGYRIIMGMKGIIKVLQLNE